MVVDDELAQRVAVSFLCKAIGVPEVIEHASARAALSNLSSRATPLDLVICDLDLPEMDGMEFIRRLGTLASLPAILIVSGHHQSVLESVEFMGRAYGLTVLGSLPKPLTRPVLEPILTRLAAGGAAAAAAPAIEKAEIDSLIDTGRFEPYFQPQLRLPELSVDGVEVLARLVHDDGAVYPPDVFLTRLEERDMLADLTVEIMGKALKVVADWPAKAAGVRVSFNIAPKMISDFKIMQSLMDRVDRSGVASGRIVFEIVETAMEDNRKTFMESAARLRLRGFGLSIDDFGQGHATLDQLRRLPFSELKIDRAFVSGMTEDASNRAIVANTVSMSKAMGLRVVAEGVESESEAQMLAGFGCDSAQGFLYSKALSAGHLTEYLADKECHVG